MIKYFITLIHAKYVLKDFSQNIEMVWKTIV